LISEFINNIINLGNKIFGVVIESGWIKINSIDDYYKLKESYDEFYGAYKTRTDWAVRSEMYNNISWVNKEETLDAMFELCNNSCTNPKILDIGVGTGKVLKYFKNKINNAICYGIDISKEMMNKIDDEYEFNLLVGNVEELSEFGNDTFDIVTARMSFHHVKNLKKAMSEVYRVLKKDGKFIICEGVPPNKETLEFYKEMFKYKEDRNTFLVDDLINLMNDTGLRKITTRTIINKGMSMNNWLNNSGVPYRNQDIIRKMHFECSKDIQKSYKMEFVGDDILMEWKFIVVCGIK
ncbi:class I SAM-dependent methyltransferase, partial [Clostridium neonatale]